MRSSLVTTAYSATADGPSMAAMMMLFDVNATATASCSTRNSRPTRSRVRAIVQRMSWSRGRSQGARITSATPFTTVASRRPGHGQDQPRQAELHLDRHDDESERGDVAGGHEDRVDVPLLESEPHLRVRAGGHADEEAGDQHRGCRSGLVDVEGCRRLDVEDLCPWDRVVGNGEQQPEAACHGQQHREPIRNVRPDQRAIVPAGRVGDAIEQAVAQPQVGEAQECDDRAQRHPHAEPLAAEVAERQGHADGGRQEGDPLRAERRGCADTRPPEALLRAPFGGRGVERSEAEDPREAPRVDEARVDLRGDLTSSTGNREGPSRRRSRAFRRRGGRRAPVAADRPAWTR